MRIEDKQELNEQNSSEQNLEACVLVLVRWKGSLTPELRRNIQQVGRQLGEKESAVSELRNLLVNSELKDSYYAARRELYQKYSVRERAKSGIATLPSGNLILETAKFIATADDFVTAAYKLVTAPSWQARVKKASDDVQTFGKTLEETAIGLDALSVALLKNIDQDVFTLDALAYRLDLPKNQVQPVLEDLWRRSYVRPLSGNVLGNLWGRLNIFAPKQGVLDTEHHYLGLTVKGYYYLHPHPIYTAILPGRGFAVTKAK